MRVISGAWRGRPLVAPTGETTRPTSDRAREALFSMLTSRIGSFEDLRVADIFAGTGALGLEALSRGAAHCTFIETHADALTALKTNIAKLGAAERSNIIARPAESRMTTGEPCHLLFLDPPYGSSLGQKALPRLAAGGWIAPGAWISLETARDETVDLPGFEVDAVRDHGKARLHILRYA